MNTLPKNGKLPTKLKPIAQAVTATKKHMVHTATCKPLDGLTVVDMAIDMVVIGQVETALSLKIK